MNKQRLQKSLIALSASLAAATAVALSSLPAEKAPQLDVIKKLEGTWVSVDEAGEPTDEVVSIYHVTAGGSAVLETEFPGTEKEMLTVFSMDRGTLQLQHFCILGNAPHMVLQEGSTEKELIFECKGEGGNYDCSRDKHMHHGHYRFPSPDRISSTWNMIENGEVIYTAEFELARKTDGDN